MKFIAIPFLILLIMAQTFSMWFVVFSFSMNRDYIAKNLCENRYRPQLNCNGHCVLMKKLKQQEQDEQQAPTAIKVDLSTILFSSKCHFAGMEETSYVVPKVFLPIANTGIPVDQAFAIFHPPKV